MKHVKRENYTINKRHEKINEKFTYLEEETMKLLQKKNFLLSVILPVLVKLQ